MRSRGSKRCRGVAPRRDPNRTSPGGQRRLHVERRVADQDGRAAREIRPVRAARREPGHRHELGPYLVHVPVRADRQVQMTGAEPRQPQLQRRERPDVTGEYGLADTNQGQLIDGRRRPGHGPHVSPHGAGGRQLAQRGEEAIHLVSRRGDPGERERVQDDRPVGPPGLRRDCGQLAAEHLAEHHLVKPRPQAAGVHQRVVDVPQHQQIAHPPRLSAG
jgi:hypothetical protein